MSLSDSLTSECATPGCGRPTRPDIQFCCYMCRDKALYGEEHSYGCNHQQAALVRDMEAEDDARHLVGSFTQFVEGGGRTIELANHLTINAFKRKFQDEKQIFPKTMS